MAQQSVIAVSDLSVFGTNFPDSYTRKEIEDYRREFNSKLVNTIKISNAQRTERFTPACYCQIMTRLLLQGGEDTPTSTLEAREYLEKMSHDEFFYLLSDLWLTDDRVLDDHAHIESEIKKIPLELTLSDPLAGYDSGGYAARGEQRLRPVDILEQI